MKIAAYGEDLTGATIINPKKADCLQEYADTLYELRKAKGMTPEKALATMQEMPFGRDTTLRRLLPQIPDTYDFVFFDCSPSLESLFNINVLVAVQYVLIPIKVDKNSIEGYDVMLETIQSVREIANPDIRALGIFMTAVETGSSLDREMIANFPAMLPGLAFQTFIRKNIDVKKAPLALQPLCFFSPRCTATADYAALCDEMLARMEG